MIVRRSRLLWEAAFVGLLALLAATSTPGCSSPRKWRSCANGDTCQNVAGGEGGGADAGAAGTKGRINSGAGGYAGAVGDDISHGGDGDSGAPQGQAGADDGSVAPRVLAIMPDDHAVGIASEAVIEIGFSRPMDEASVESALTVGDFLPDDLELSWDTDDTTLTVVPKAGFEYASVSDQTGPARIYEITLTTQARDSRGVHLAAAFTSSFSTLREVSQQFVSPEAAEYNTYGGGVGDNVHSCEGDGTYQTKVGSFSNTAVSGTFFVFVPVDLTSLSDPTLLTNVEAHFTAAQADPEGPFYSAGSVVLDKVAYGPIDDNVYALPVTNNLGTLCSSAATTRPSLDITSALWEAYSAGEQRQLYRVSAVASADNTEAKFSCDGFAITVDYRIP